MVRMELTQDETPEVWDRVMALNCNGPFYLSLAALPHLLEQKGNIVNLASVAGIMGQAYTAAYCSSKHALIGLTKSMALEFGRQGLRVNAICPGAVNTNLIQTISVPDGVEPDLIARYNFAEAAAEADEVAKMIAYVASDDARSPCFATGQKQPTRIRSSFCRGWLCNGQRRSALRQHRLELPRSGPSRCDSQSA